MLVHERLHRPASTLRTLRIIGTHPNATSILKLRLRQHKELLPALHINDGHNWCHGRVSACTTLHCVVYTPPMSRIDSLLSQLADAAKSKKLSKRRIAALTGMHPNTLRSFGQSAWAPSPLTIRRLETILLDQPHPNDAMK